MNIRTLVLKFGCGFVHRITQICISGLGLWGLHTWFLWWVDPH